MNRQHGASPTRCCRSALQRLRTVAASDFIHVSDWIEGICHEGSHWDEKTVAIGTADAPINVAKGNYSTGL